MPVAIVPPGFCAKCPVPKFLNEYGDIRNFSGPSCDERVRVHTLSLVSSLGMIGMCPNQGPIQDEDPELATCAHELSGNIDSVTEAVGILPYITTEEYQGKSGE